MICLAANDLHLRGFGVRFFFLLYRWTAFANERHRPVLYSEFALLGELLSLTSSTFPCMLFGVVPLRGVLAMTAHELNLSVFLVRSCPSVLLPRSDLQPWTVRVPPHSLAWHGSFFFFFNCPLSLLSGSSFISNCCASWFGVMAAIRFWALFWSWAFWWLSRLSCCCVSYRCWL